MNHSTESVPALNRSIVLPVHVFFSRFEQDNKCKSLIFRITRISFLSIASNFMANSVNKWQY